MSYVTSDCAYSYLKYMLINGQDYDQEEDTTAVQR